MLNHDNNHLHITQMMVGKKLFSPSLLNSSLPQLKFSHHNVFHNLYEVLLHFIC